MITKSMCGTIAKSIVALLTIIVLITITGACASRYKRLSDYELERQRLRILRSGPDYLKWSPPNRWETPHESHKWIVLWGNESDEVFRVAASIGPYHVCNIHVYEDSITSPHPQRYISDYSYIYLDPTYIRIVPDLGPVTTTPHKENIFVGLYHGLPTPLGSSHTPIDQHVVGSVEIVHFITLDEIWDREMEKLKLEEKYRRWRDTGIILIPGY